ncbi:MAG TPA: HD domain-containing phosphohydrolase [Vicinamibacterales bacterium]|nr:HD domain-containing phosphohydrolase [Vicinamibacterales bacterium]
MESETVSAADTPARGRVLVVDDIEANRNLVARALAADGHVVIPAEDGESALEAVTRETPDLVLMDVMMPKLDGFQVCRALKHQPATRLVPVVLVTALQNSEDRIRGIEAGADDFISKPFNAHELRARVRSLIRIKRYTDELDTAESVIVSLALTIEARDRCTEGHCQRLASYASAVGRAIGLSDADIAALARGGYLHDIGKVGIPDAVLLKTDRLSRSEYDLMKQHAVIGDRLCGELRALRRVRPIVRHHHERLDGSGYPDGLRGDGIPLLAQIIAIVDVYDALTTARPYKTAHSPAHAFSELIAEARRGLHRRDLVDAFVALGQRGQLPRHHAEVMTPTSAA